VPITVFVATSNLSIAQAARAEPSRVIHTHTHTHTHTHSLSPSSRLCAFAFPSGLRTRPNLRTNPQTHQRDLPSSLHRSRLTLEEKLRAVVLALGSCTAYTGKVYCLAHRFLPSGVGITDGEDDEMADNYSILMSRFPWKHIVDLQAIRTYVVVGIGGNKLC